VSWFGSAGEALARALELPRVEAHASLSSTMDEAHALAAGGAAAGTLVLAELQTAGRGRSGKRWISEPRAGIWATIIERPRDASGLDVLSLRVGLNLAKVLTRWTPSTVQLKWPNDLFVGGCKLAGVLIEARWRDQRPDWVAIGIGINLVVPADQPDATALVLADAKDVLGEMVPALRAAAFATGPLSERELNDFAARDVTRDRRLLAPAAGLARGITADGALLIESNGAVTSYRAGSLVLSS
jgi:BirA family transcriptional regulator, biotin operon repressor / biotin---[acetyl-CoA-carboxylase] ligase